MNIVRVKDADRVKELFGDWQESLIWSCLDGTMGYLYAEDTEKPESVMAMLGDFSFYAGKVSEELVRYKPKECKLNYTIMTPQNEEWENMILKVYGEKAKRFPRYAIKKEGDVFDREKLKDAVDSLSPEYTIQLLDRNLFEYAKHNDWTNDWCSQYDTYEEFEKIGLGVVICKDGDPVAGVCSYSCYKGGIEIEIDTKEEYRRQGLAYCGAAKLILLCLERGLYPSWDAANLRSVALAEKLGYHFSHEYIAYIVRDYQ